jgi:pSer/pThr/pTyr-binding forkhead associated (FHA) protein
MLRFIVFHNDQPIKTYEVDDPVITIGRLPENTISIANMGISRRHVRIERDANRNYTLSDLNSLNGTYVNNKKVRKCTLGSGDRIAIGKYVILFELVQRRGEEQPAVAATQAQAYSPPRHAPADSRPQQPVAQPVQQLHHEQESGQAVLIETNKHVVYRLDKSILSVGSSEDDDIFVSGFMIGDSHVFVEHKDDGIWIHSKKSMGKFKVNGKKTSNHRLEHKDRIEIGNSTFRYMENG